MPPPARTPATSTRSPPAISPGMPPAQPSMSRRPRRCLPAAPRAASRCPWTARRETGSPPRAGQSSGDVEGDVRAGQGLAYRARVLGVLGDLPERILVDAVGGSPDSQLDTADPESARRIGGQRDVTPDGQRWRAATGRAEQRRELHRITGRVRGGDELLWAGRAVGVVGGPLGEGDLIGPGARTEQFESATSILKTACPCGPGAAGRHCSSSFAGTACRP